MMLTRKTFTPRGLTLDLNLNPNLDLNFGRALNRALCVAMGVTLGLLLSLPGQVSAAPAIDRGQKQASAVFQILASELALAQGEVGVAAATYLNLARQTQDPAAAKRATELAIEAKSPQRAQEAAALWLKNAPNDQEAQATIDLLQVVLGENEKVTTSLIARRKTMLQAMQQPQVERKDADKGKAKEPGPDVRMDVFYDYVAGLAGRAPTKTDGLKIFERVTQPDQDKPAVMYTRAMLYERAGQAGEMENILRRIIAKDPQHAHAYNALGYHLADRNVRLDEAFQLIERALALAPNDAHIIDSMGWVYFRKGNLDLAEKYLRMAYIQQPDAEVSTHLAEVLWVKGQATEAETFFRAAFNADPRNEVLIETLKRLGISPVQAHPK